MIEPISLFRDKPPGTFCRRASSVGKRSEVIEGGTAGWGMSST
jgi:hypothetical protein